MNSTVWRALKSRLSSRRRRSVNHRTGKLGVSDGDGFNHGGCGAGGGRESSVWDDTGGVARGGRGVRAPEVSGGAVGGCTVQAAGGTAGGGDDAAGRSEGAAGGGGGLRGGGGDLGDGE